MSLWSTLEVQGWGQERPEEKTAPPQLPQEATASDRLPEAALLASCTVLVGHYTHSTKRQVCSPLSAGLSPDSSQKLARFKPQETRAQGLLMKPLSVFSVNLGLKYFLSKQKRGTPVTFIKASSDLKRNRPLMRGCGVWGPPSPHFFAQEQSLVAGPC